MDRTRGGIPCRPTFSLELIRAKRPASFSSFSSSKKNLNLSSGGTFSLLAFPFRADRSIVLRTLKKLELRSRGQELHSLPCVEIERGLLGL